ncbi:putative zinc-binding metallopeptidase [bacterium]|nr:putative zinc-binding metallopeptidase [bacterium]
MVAWLSGHAARFGGTLVVMLACFLFAAPLAWPQSATKARSRSKRNGKTAAANQKICDRLQKKYGVEFLVKDGEVNKRTWKEFDCQFATDNDQPQLLAFLKIFEAEFSKYPTEFVKKSKLQQVVFAKAMAINGQYRAAVPDYSAETLYYDFQMKSQDHYQYRVIHHEYYHMIEEQHHGDAYFKDPAWAALNEPGFKYGKGGAANRSTALSKYTFPQQGFINAYAMSGLEEDKAEIWSIMFVPQIWNKIKQRVGRDRIIRKKVAYMQKFASQQSKTMTGKYWQRTALK